MDWLDLKISIHVEAIHSPWFTEHLVVIEEWWGIPFLWTLKNSNDPVTLQPWDNLHVLSDGFVTAHTQSADLNLIVCPPQVQPTFLGLYRPWDRVSQIFVTETDHIYQLGKDQGPSCEVMANHEMSHHFYAVLGLPDNTHRYFFAGTPELARDEIRAAFEAKKVSMNPDALLPDWSIIAAAHHNVRALCDLEGLTYEQKEVLTACVMVESGFNINAVHQNYAFKNGIRILETTDHGIVQVNDYWHIGPGKDFPSVDYVLAHSEECVRWMCRYYKANGNLNAWCSYTSGAYKRWVGKV